MHTDYISNTFSLSFCTGISLICVDVAPAREEKGAYAATPLLPAHTHTHTHTHSLAHSFILRVHPYVYACMYYNQCPYIIAIVYAH